MVGAGLAGLAASLRLAKAGIRVFLHEAAPQAGGRCRSYFDEALGCRIDNGNHLIMAGSTAVQSYLREIGAVETLSGPAEPEFHFLDIKTNERWIVRPNSGRFPWWILSVKRRVPGTHIWDYLGALRLIWAGPQDNLTSVLDRESLIFQRLCLPLSVSALNTEVDEAAAAAALRVLQETFGRGGAACRPLTPIDGFVRKLHRSGARTIARHGGRVHLGSRLRAVNVSGDRVSSLSFDEGDETLEHDERNTTCGTCIDGRSHRPEFDSTR